MLNSTFACMFVINWEVFFKVLLFGMGKYKENGNSLLSCHGQTYGDFIGPGLSFIVTAH